jgi:hypothetical protein
MTSRSRDRYECDKMNFDLALPNFASFALSPASNFRLSHLLPQHQRHCQLLKGNVIRRCLLRKRFRALPTNCISHLSTSFHCHVSYFPAFATPLGYYATVTGTDLSPGTGYIKVLIAQKERNSNSRNGINAPSQTVHERFAR